LVIQDQLKAIFIEVSFDNSVPEKALFGHLTPKLLMEEMAKLDQLTNGHLKNVQLYVTHIKPCDSCETTIKAEILAANQIGLNIFYPTQATMIELK
jgi:3',5'-cyclic-nucleotide phosphodiesterase